MIAARYIPLVEYDPVFLEASDFDDELAAILERDYGRQVELQYPTRRTQNRWLFKSKGWVGLVPLSEQVVLELQPRNEIAAPNVFAMLEYAYGLSDRSFALLEGQIETESVQDFYSRWAAILARRTLHRTKRGLHRAYIDVSEASSFLRGRMEISEAIRRPWRVALPCSFQEHTTDIEDNRIIAGALSRVVRNPACSDTALRISSRANRVMTSAVGDIVTDARACVGRTYSRLNEDYRPLHAICRFFLENSGPSHIAGTMPLTPFLVDMARLYELFVYEWLRQHCPREDISLQAQSIYDVDIEGEEFRIDIVVRDRNGRPLMVVDTKSMPARRPSAQHLQQVVAYAEAIRCTEAVLVYPTPELERYSVVIGDVRVRALPFPLSGALDQAGVTFTTSLFSVIE